MQIDLQSFAGLRCRVLNPNPQRHRAPRMLVVLNHGFGAPGDDLVDLGGWLAESSEDIEEHCIFVFPAAPIDLGPMGMPGGRAWWPINMARLAEINQTRNFSELTNLQPDGLLEASQQLTECLRQLQQMFALDDSQTVLGGFSQGAMVSTDVTLRHGVCPRLLLLFSGTLICRDEWKQLATQHPGCAVFQTHGTVDPILPFPPAKELSALLSEAGFATEFQEFNGPHTIQFQSLQAVSQRLTAYLRN